MTDVRQEMRELLDQVRTQRDDLRVRLHLARADARVQWARLEKTVEHARGRLAVLGREAGKAAGEVAAALRLAVDEFKKGYASVRRLV